MGSYIDPPDSTSAKNAKDENHSKSERLFWYNRGRRINHDLIEGYVWLATTAAPARLAKVVRPAVFLGGRSLDSLAARPGGGGAPLGNGASQRAAGFRPGPTQRGGGQPAALARPLRAGAASGSADLPGIHQPGDRRPAGDLCRDGEEPREPGAAQVRAAPPLRSAPGAGRLGFQRVG